MQRVTFLGPAGATFSYDAYECLKGVYDLPSPLEEVTVGSNGEILPAICEHGGYGVAAMDTLAEGRVTEPLESFIDLLKAYSQDACPIRVIGAVQMRLDFCLIARNGLRHESIDHIIAHPKSFGACKGWIKSQGYLMTPVTSNGEAARLIAERDEYATSAALGPRSAATKYGLSILERGCEDQRAITTFFLLGPASHPVTVGGKNRMLIVFSVPHTSGALVKALHPFEREGLNMIQIHSVHVGNHTYHFAIELEVGKEELDQVQRAMEDFGRVCESFISFGPFEVLSC